jgi:hypothetical protein
MGDDIDRVYAGADLGEVSRTFVKELVRLHLRGPMTISALAESVQGSPFKLDRKVADMEAVGLVTTTATADGQDRTVAVTPRTKQIVGRLIAEWEATESTIAEVEAEMPYPISRAAADLETVLRRKSFHDRILEKLVANPSWSKSP